MKTSTVTSLKDDKKSAAEGKQGMEKELSEIKREVVESRNLVIKTDNLLKNLHAELKTVAKQGEDAARKTWFASAAAYVIFAGLCIAGAVLVSSASTRSSEAERERLARQVGELTSQLDLQKVETDANVASRQQAAEVYRMMTSLPGDERLKGIDALMALDTTRLSSLERSALSDRAEALRKEIGSVAFERGKTAFRRNDMQATVTELTRFMAMNPGEDDALEASFFLGVAHNQLHQHEEAMPYFDRFVNGRRNSRNRDYAMLLMAHSLERTGQPEKASELARTAIETYPGSEFIPQLRNRMAAARRAAKAASDAAATATE